MYPQAGERDGDLEAIRAAENPKPSSIKLILESPVHTAASMAVVANTAIANVAAQLPGLKVLRPKTL